MNIDFLGTNGSRKIVYIGLSFLMMIFFALLGDFGHANPVLFGLVMFMLCAGVILFWLLIACSFIQGGYRWFWALPFAFLFCFALGWSALYFSSHHGESSFNYQLLAAPVFFSLPSFVAGGGIYVLIMSKKRNREERIKRTSRRFLVVFCGCFLFVLNVGLYGVPCLNYFSHDGYLEETAKRAVIEKFGGSECRLQLKEVDFYEKGAHERTNDLEFLFMDSEYYYEVCVSAHGGVWHIYRRNIFYPGE